MSAFSCTIHDVEAASGFHGDASRRSGVAVHLPAYEMTADVPECLVVFKSDRGDIVFNGDGDDEPELF